MEKIVLLGEPLLRLSPEGYQRFAQADRLLMHFGGAEANVAVCLAGLGKEACFVGKVPDNALGEAFKASMRKYGVYTDYVVSGEGRLGIYYLENGMSVRPSSVIYDRANSAMSNAECSEFDWKAIFRGAEWFHLSGITPVISEKAAELSLCAVMYAKEYGIPVSFDLNYRAKLWQTDIEKKQAVMAKIAEYADYCFGNALDACRTMGYQDNNLCFEKEEFEAYISEKSTKRMAEAYGFDGVFFTVRDSISASDNKLSAKGFYQGKFYQTDSYSLHIADRVGSGDAFAAGIIYGLTKKLSAQKILETGLAAGAIAHTIPGDMTVTSIEELNAVMENKGSGRVVR